MLKDIFYAVIFEPLYNALVLLISVIPGGSAGLAIIALTIVVKIALFPLAKRATQTQITLKKVAPLLEEIKRKYKDNQQEQLTHMFALYKEHNVHPLSGLVPIFFQLPIVIGLYLVFLKGGLPTVDQSLLYSFVPTPPVVDMDFLNIFPLTEKSMVLAALVGFSQFILGYFTFDTPNTASKPGTSMRDDIMRSMHFQMKYFLPILFGVFAYVFSSAVALHWLTGNLFGIGQDFLIRRRFRDMSNTHGTGSNQHT